MAANAIGDFTTKQLSKILKVKEKAYGLFSVFDATDVFMVDKDHFTQAGLGYSLLRAKVLDPLAKLFKIHR